MLVSSAIFAASTVVVKLVPQKDGTFKKVVDCRPEWAPQIADADPRIKDRIVIDLSGVSDKKRSNIVRRLYNAGIDVPGIGVYFPSGAGSAAKSGRLHAYRIKGTVQRWYYKKDKDVVRMGVKHTPLYGGMCNIRASIRIVKTGECRTGDGQAHASVSWLKSLAVALDWKGPLTLAQIRFWIGETIDVDLKGTIVPDESVTDCDLVLPESCVKGNTDKLGEAADVMLVGGVVSWAEAHDFTIGYQVSQYWGKSIQDVINRTWTLRSDKIKAMATDPVVFASAIPVASVRTPSGKIDHMALYRRVADFAVTAGSTEILYTRRWVELLNDTIRQMNISQTVAGGLKARGLKGVAVPELAKDAIVVNPKDFTPAQRKRLQAVVGRSPHTDPTETVGVRILWSELVFRGCVYLNPELAGLMAGDFDGDEYFVHIVEEEVGQAWFDWLGTLDRKIGGEKRRMAGNGQGDAVDFILANLDSDIGRIDSILGKMWLVNPGDPRRAQVRDELQTEIDRAKHGGQTDWEFLNAIAVELKECLEPNDVRFRELANGTVNVWGLWAKNRMYRESVAKGKPLNVNPKAVVLPWTMGDTGRSWIGNQFNTRARSLPIPAMHQRDNRLVQDYLPRPDKCQAQEWAMERYNEAIREMQMIEAVKDESEHSRLKQQLMLNWMNLWHNQLQHRDEAWLIQASRALWHRAHNGDSAGNLCWYAIPEITLSDLEAHIAHIKAKPETTNVDLIGPVAKILPRNEMLFGKIVAYQPKNEANGDRAISWNGQLIMVRGSHIPPVNATVNFWAGDNKHASTVAGVVTTVDVQTVV